MFTGLVREIGRVASFDGGRIVVECATAAAVGDSVALDGVCLTVVDAGTSSLSFDAVPETLARVKPFGDRVNVEPARLSRCRHIARIEPRVLEPDRSHADGHRVRASAQLVHEPARFLARDPA